MSGEIGARSENEVHHLEELVRRPGVVLVSWWSPRSPAAVAFAAEYASAAAATDDATFAAIDVGEHAALAMTYGVSDVPTVMAFRDGVLVYRQSGFLPAAAVRQIVQATQAADPSTLRQAWNGTGEGEHHDRSDEPEPTKH
jgi:thioredoxin-like negative regulator of GroEL